MPFPKRLSRLITLIVSLAFADLALAVPKVFTDDFQTVKTYNRQTFVDACAGTIPDWTIQGTLDSSTLYERAVSGGGRLLISNWAFDNAFSVPMDFRPIGIPAPDASHWGARMETLFVGWSGVGLSPCPNEPDPGESSEIFVHDNLCILGGFQLNRFQLSPYTTSPLGPLRLPVYGRQYFGTTDVFGSQPYLPGKPGVDDDQNGFTDDDPNCGVGNDLQPGKAFVDDDGNGITDDLRELYWCGCGTECLPGPDGFPGDPLVDDDGDGTTDERDEGCPANEFGVNTGPTKPTDDFYCPGEVDDTFIDTGRPSPEYLHMGNDGQPGVAGMDDDGNGITDLTDVPGIIGVDDDRDGTTDNAGEFQFDMAEYGWPGSDDTDDLSGEWAFAFAMRMDVGTGNFIGLVIEPENDGFSWGAELGIQSWINFRFNVQTIHGSNPNRSSQGQNWDGDYLPDTPYSFSFCAKGTSYSAQLWLESDPANPIETLGPVSTTLHQNKNDDKEVGIVTFQGLNGLYNPIQNLTILPNKLFCNKFWVVEDPALVGGLPDRTDGDGDGVGNFCDTCPVDYNPPNTAPKDCNADGDGGLGGDPGEAIGEQCNVCSCQ